MATRLSMGAAGGNPELMPMNIAAGAERDTSSRGQATNLSGSHRPSTTNNIMSQVEYFADEIVLGELEKRQIMGVRVNRRMSLAIVACCCVSVALLGVIMAKTFSHGGSGGDEEETHNTKTISKADGDSRYSQFQSTLEPVAGGSIDEPGTPEADALYWISYDDPGALDPHAPIDKVIQRFVLATLYFSTKGSDWEHSFDFMTHHDVCDWNHQGDSKGGAYCDKNGFVDSLILTGLNLAGALPKDLGLLTHMTHLDLSNNNIEDQLPSTIGLLRKLTTLDVSHNELSGFAPNNAQKLTNLEVLNLNNNHFEGGIPYEYLADLPKIERINFSFNSFTGIVHDDLNDLWGMKSLLQLELQNNKFEGGLPTFLSQIESLKILNLSNNEFTGKLSPEFGNMTALTQFDIGHNKLTGSIPSTFGDATDANTGDMALTIFRAPSNNLVGSFPVRFTNITNLGIIDLGDNGLDGSIPPEIGNMKFLQVLDLSKNSFGSSIATRLGTCASMVQLNLSNNRLVERLPTELGALGSLGKLDIRNNMLEGSVPTQLRNLPELTSLLLSGNNFIDDLDPILCNRPVDFPAWETFEADCATGILTCSCCTSCCNLEKACCTPGTKSCNSL